MHPLHPNTVAMPAAAAVPAGLDTRSRILDAAMLLFRQRGYHGVGINDILAIANAPKGSLYHHFPGGKDELAVKAIELVSGRLLALIEGDSSGTATQRMRRVGVRLQRWMQSTRSADGASACAVLASFAAEGDTAVAVAGAVKAAYERVAIVLARFLVADGWPARTAKDRAFLVIAILEGGGLVSQTMNEPRLFTAAIEQAAALCTPIPTRKVPQ